MLSLQMADCPVESIVLDAFNAELSACASGTAASRDLLGGGRPLPYCDGSDAAESKSADERDQTIKSTDSLAKKRRSLSTLSDEPISSDAAALKDAPNAKRTLSTLSDEPVQRQLSWLSGVPELQEIAEVAESFPDTLRWPRFGFRAPWFFRNQILPYMPVWGFREPRADPLNMKIVPPAQTSKSKQKLTDVKTPLQHQPIVRHSFGTVRCFTATTKANPRYLSVRATQDVATQIRWWDFYKCQCRKDGVKMGLYLNPHFAEWISGFPPNWTVPEPGCMLRDCWPQWFGSTEASRRKLPILSLFAGVGGLDIGVQEIWQTIAYVENNSYCQEVLKARMQDGCLHKGGIISDVQDYEPAGSHLSAEGLIGGFPCQGVCRAGKMLGLDDSRTGLVREIYRLIDSLPSLFFCFLENVAHLLSPKNRELLHYVCKEFGARGFSLRWCTVTGTNVGAQVNRERIFLLATRGQQDPLEGLQLQSSSDMHQSAHAAWNRCCKPPVSAWLLAQQSALDKERLKACGNVVIPQCARLALHIMGNHLS